MIQPLLSLLIPTVIGRESQFKKLTETLYPQIAKYWDVKYIGSSKAEIEVIYDLDNKEKTIGEKREFLYSKAKGIYSWQIDDDDSIAPNAIQLILEAIKSNPDIPTITFRERCMMNGVYKTSNHSIRYDRWQDNFDGYDYVRCAFYKDVIRTDIAKSVPFPKIRWNEDEQWSYAIKDLLTSEKHIEEELYYYIYEPKDTHEIRYGINKG